MKHLNFRLTYEGERVTRVQYRHRWRWVTVTPDNAVFGLSNLFKGASQHVLENINRDLRRWIQAEKEWDRKQGKED